MFSGGISLGGGFGASAEAPKADFNADIPSGGIGGGIGGGLGK